MKKFYELIKKNNKDLNSKVATVIKGEHTGEKALFTKGQMIYESVEGGFFSRWGKELGGKKETKVIDIGENSVFVDLLSPEKKLVICGGGHVSIPIIKIGIMADFQVTVIEDRVTFANHARNAGAHKVICKDFKGALDEVEGDENTYFVIVTRGHRYDQTCLEEIIKEPNAYVGMIGSKLRVKKVKEELIERGWDPKELEKIYSPIGLDIKAETPVEIAIAIMAEVILVKNQENRGSGYPKEIMKELLGGQYGENKHNEQKEWVMATIVSRKGSAPRDVGTKMVIRPDGQIIGTIGGGCAESDVMTKALDLFYREDNPTILHHIDMTGEDAEEDGMVCGGVIEVLLEKIQF